MKQLRVLIIDLASVLIVYNCNMFGRAILVGGLLAVLWFGFSPTPALAQNIAGFAGCDGPDCSACNIISLANEGLQWFIGFLFVLFALLVAWAGAQLVVSGGSHHALDEAKSKFTNAIVGLLIILAAWLVVDTIMRGLVGQTGHEGEVQYVSGWLAWSEVQCYDQTNPNSNGIERDGSIDVNVEDVASYQIETFSDATYVGGGATGGGAGGGAGDSGGGATGGTGRNCPAAPESSVVTIPGTRFKARPDFVRDFVAAREAAARDGVTLTVTSGWRSEATQVAIWNDHGCNTRSCRGIVARPCSMGGNGSNHNQGNAVDVSGVRGSAAYNWLSRNGGRYRLYNRLGPDDPFHWSRTGG